MPSHQQEIAPVLPSLKLTLLTLCLGAALIGAGCSRALDDRQIAAHIRSQIQQDSAIHGEIQVVSVRGTVTLNGQVENEAERLLASRDAVAVAGVKQVVNNLAIVLAAPAAAALPELSPPVAALQPVPAATATPQPAALSADRSSDRLISRRTARAATPPNLPTMARNIPPSALPLPPAAAAPPAEPAATMLPSPPARVHHAIPAGTMLSVRLINRLDSSRNRVGDTFRATLNAPLRENGAVVVPAGADVEGRVVAASNAGPYSGHSELKLELSRLICRGEVYALQTESYGRAEDGRGKGTAQAVGGGAALGAVIGASASGGKGAAIGSRQARVPAP